MPSRSRLRFRVTPEFLSPRTSALASLWILALIVPALAARGSEPAQAQAQGGGSVLTVVERSIVQDQGGWQIDYRLRHQGPTIAVGAPDEIQAKIEAWVSNSRVTRHAVPRLSTLVVAGSASAPPWSAFGDVIASTDEAQRCRERVTLQVWPDDEPEQTHAPSSPQSPAAADGETARTEPDAPRERHPLMTLASESIVRVRLRLEHQHILFGDYDPLLGQRQVELRLGTAILRDLLSMDREQYLAMPRATWPAPPDDRCDDRHFISAPSSLHLEAHIPGNEHYRFAERPVRYATKMRLRFWYLIASGTEGECRGRVIQAKDTPIAYKILHDAVQVECLTRVGRWVKVERVFRTEPEATHLLLEFQICDPNDTRIGELWIDNVSLEPILAGPAGP